MRYLSFNVILIVLHLSVYLSASLYSGSFSSSFWTPAERHASQKAESATFTVALKVRNENEMRQEFLQVSDPASSKYGRYVYEYVILLNKYRKI